jgi:hypothetical protein
MLVAGGGSRSITAPADVVLFGAEINSEAERQARKDTTADRSGCA